MPPKHITVDFVAPPAAARVGRVLLGLGLLALVVGGVNLALAWSEHQRERTELAALAGRVNPQNSGIRRASPVNASAMLVAASVAADLSAPWPELLRSMEASRSRDIALVRVEPVAARGTLRITADARHAEAMLDYLEQLDAQGLADVTLTSHQVQAQQPGTPIRFQVQARWAGLKSGPTTTAAPRGDSGGAETEPATDTATERFLLNARAAR